MLGSRPPLELHVVLYKTKCPSVILCGEGLNREQPDQGGAVRDEGEWSCLEVRGKHVNCPKVLLGIPYRSVTLFCQSLTIGDLHMISFSQPFPESI